MSLPKVSAMVASSCELEEVVVNQFRQPVQVYQYTV